MATYNFTGHDDGLNVINDGYGNFHDEPMTPGQLAAREPARIIESRIYELAHHAGFAYIKAHEIIAPFIDAELAQARQELAELRGTLQELRARFHAAGRRPEECYEMSLIDSALLLRQAAGGSDG